MLAGLAKAPSRYAPTSNLEMAQARSRVVLKLLRENEVISEAQYAFAYALPAILANRTVSGDINYFLDFVTWEVNKYVTSPDVDLVVHTTLDRQLQAKGEAAVKTVMSQLGEIRNVEQAALVALATDGAVRAMVGGISYEDSQFNRAAQALRQPGSAFKPFVYLTALERGLKPDDVYLDAPIRLGDWSPTNYSNRYRGRVTLTQAFESSINTVAVRIAQDVGAENIVETAHRLGITSTLNPNRSLPLGTSEVTLLELTAAYVPFAKQGLSTDRYAITRIETQDGEVVYEREAPEERRLFDKSVARNMTHMMFQVMYSGTGKRAALENHPAAGKTGTSQEWRDAWFMGFTPDLVTGVWVGNDDASPTDHVTGGQVPAQIWHEFMTAALEGERVAELPGAFPSREIETNKDMREFLADLSSQFRRIKSKPKGRRKGRSLWPFCDDRNTDGAQNRLVAPKPLAMDMDIASRHIPLPCHLCSHYRTFR